MMETNLFAMVVTHGGFTATDVAALMVITGVVSIAWIYMIIYEVVIMPKR